MLADCHEREVLHGDVKPQNMISSIDKTRIWLVDFGSACIKNGAALLPSPVAWLNGSSMAIELTYARCYRWIYRLVMLSYPRMEHLRVRLC